MIPTKDFHYIAILDYAQMGQTLYLKALARGMQQQKKARGILLHADNARTDQLLQEGIPRKEARKRVTRENGRRLTDVLSESGIASVAMSAGQLGSASTEKGYVIREDVSRIIPGQIHLILSNQTDEEGSFFELEEGALQIAERLSIQHIGIVRAADQRRNQDALSVQTDTDTPKKSPRIQTWSIQDWAQIDALFGL